MKLNREKFISHFGDVFESSPWFAESVFERRGGAFASAGELADEFAAALRRAGHQEQIDLLRAHPELACAMRRDLTELSRREQAAAGLDNCSRAEFDAFEALNVEYRSRFGFPFIIAVAGLTREDILLSFRERVGNDPESEFETALNEVCKIASLRIANAFED